MVRPARTYSLAASGVNTVAGGQIRLASARATVFVTQLWEPLPGGLPVIPSRRGRTWRQPGKVPLQLGGEREPVRVIP